MRRQRLREQRSSRHREVVRHRHDLERVIERARDDLDDLPHREHLVVRRVEHVTSCCAGVVDGEQDRVGEVLRVAVMVQREAVVGDDDALATVEDPPHDRPLPWRELVRPVHVRVPEVRGGGMVLEHRLLRPHDPVALLVLGRIRDLRRALRHRHRQARRVEQPGVHPAPVGRDAAHRHERARRAPPRDARSNAAGRTSRRAHRTSARRVLARDPRRRTDRGAGAARIPVSRRARACRGGGSSRRDRARPDRARSGCRSVRSRRSPAHARPSRGAYRRTLTRSAHRNPPPAVRTSRRPRRDPASGPPRRGPRLLRRLGQ